MLRPLRIFFLIILLQTGLLLAPVMADLAAVAHAKDGNGGDGGGDDGGGDDGDGDDGGHDSDYGDDGDDDYGGGGFGAGEGGRKPKRGYTNKLNELQKGVQNKTLLPLSVLKAIVLARVGGSIIEIETKQKSGRWQYEFKVINRSGRLVEVYLDARTGRITRVEND